MMKCSRVRSAVYEKIGGLIMDWQGRGEEVPR
jgi:hypothetical protein